MCDNLPTKDDRTRGTGDIKRQEERNALRNEKSRHPRGGFECRFLGLLEFGREAKVLLDLEIIFRSYCQVTKLRPYATFFGI